MSQNTPTNPDHNNNAYEELSDDDLLALLVKGDQNAGGELYVRHFGPVRRTCRSVVRNPELASDVAQDTFVEFLRQVHAVDLDRGSVATYLHLVARRRSIDAVRRTERSRARDHDAWERWSPPQPTPEDEVIDAAIREPLRAAVAGLPEPQRQIVDMTYFGYHTTPQAANVLGIPAGTAKSRKRLALARLARDRRIGSTVS